MDYGSLLGPSAPESIVTLCWIAFIVFWVYSAIGTKRYVHRGSWGIGLRIVILIVLILLFRIPSVRGFFIRQEDLTSLYPLLQWLGAALAVCGVSFAIWARVHLGRNWGTPMSLKQDPELVTTGPYAYVRHPIYSGMILSMFGTMLVIFWWIIPFVASFIYFVWAAKTEEKIMIKQFPNQYPGYLQRTKMLIPFVF